MAAILVDDISTCILLKDIYRNPNRNSLKFVPRSSIANKPALFQVMAWRRAGNKSIPEQIMTIAYKRFSRGFVIILNKLRTNNLVAGDSMRFDAYVMSW